ncbi:MAG: riboflavin synthase [Flavobacteriales bacterium]|jgi:riboflavin synthase
MFSGIVEGIGTVVRIEQERSNIHFTLRSSFTHELAIDQSVAHNGVCLTVVALEGDLYTVTAIDETLQRTNLGEWKVGTEVNLERCLRLSDRIDGHMVQGHVDTTASCVSAEDMGGSWKYAFNYEHRPEWTTVPKGSICVNGVSLTVVDSDKGSFSVCIIPYTYEHTNFNHLVAGSRVNLEFDIIGKYVMRYMSINNL